MLQVGTEVPTSVGITGRHVWVLHESGLDDIVLIEGDYLLGTRISGIDAYLKPIGDFSVEVATERNTFERRSHTYTILVEITT